MEIETLKKEYATQDNLGTAYPIFVTVQELQCIGVADDNYGGHGDSEIKYEYISKDYEGSFESKDEIMEQINEDFGDSNIAEDYKDNIVKLAMLYLWIDVEFFLTTKGAKKFMGNNKHNMGKTRTYVKHFHSRNYEMRDLLTLLEFKLQ